MRQTLLHPECKYNQKVNQTFTFSYCLRSWKKTFSFPGSGDMNSQSVAC